MITASKLVKMKKGAPAEPLARYPQRNLAEDNEEENNDDDEEEGEYEDDDGTDEDDEDEKE